MKKGDMVLEEIVATMLGLPSDNVDSPTYPHRRIVDRVCGEYIYHERMLGPRGAGAWLDMEIQRLLGWR